MITTDTILFTRQICIAYVLAIGYHGSIMPINISDLAYYSAQAIPWDLYSRGHWPQRFFALERTHVQLICATNTCLRSTAEMRRGIDAYLSNADLGLLMSVQHFA